ALRLFQPRVALCSAELVPGNSSGAETARERGQTLARETQGRTGHLFDFGEAFFAIICSEADNLDGFVAKQVARSVNAIDADIEQCAAAERFSCADIALLYPETK